MEAGIPGRICGARSYSLWLATTGVGSNNLWGSDATTPTYVTLGRVPTNGMTIYLRRFSTRSGISVHNAARTGSPISDAGFTHHRSTRINRDHQQSKL
jgi:hypothetical protein